MPCFLPSFILRFDYAITIDDAAAHAAAADAATLALAAA